MVSFCSHYISVIVLLDAYVINELWEVNKFTHDHTKSNGDSKISFFLVKNAIYFIILESI